MGCGSSKKEKSEESPGKTEESSNAPPVPATVKPGSPVPATALEPGSGTTGGSHKPVAPRVPAVDNAKGLVKEGGAEEKKSAAKVQSTCSAAACLVGSSSLIIEFLSLCRAVRLRASTE